MKPERGIGCHDFGKSARRRKSATVLPLQADAGRHPPGRFGLGDQGPGCGPRPASFGVIFFVELTFLVVAVASLAADMLDAVGLERVAILDDPLDV